MKLTEAKLKQLILETYLQDIMKPDKTTPSGKIIWPKIPHIDFVQRQGASDQIKNSGIFKEFPKKSFLAGVNRIVDEFSIYYPVDDNDSKTKKNSRFDFAGGDGRKLVSPDKSQYIVIKISSHTFRVQVKLGPKANHSVALLRLQDYQRLPEGEEFNIFLARIREQIKSYIEANSW